MKVGTDGVLLGAWTNIDKAETILDIGTGTGLIAIMMAQRSFAKVDAVELEPVAYNQAVENIERCIWKDRVQVYNQSFQVYSETCKQRYDLIVSNPPYFSNALHAPDKKRTNARHDTTLDFEDILSGSLRLLSDHGRLNVIIPSREKNRFHQISKKHNLFCTRITQVKPLPSKEPKRVLMEVSKKEKPLSENYLVIENNKRHHFTEEYKELTKEFYLNF
jgi:tRNA1Val (adenine37-N6)-methyltransferase